mgnify:CR=1 FL=1
MKKVLVTGASGFIGQALSQSLLNSGKSIRGTFRFKKLISKNIKAEYVPVGDINNKTNWKNALVDIDCVIHCAGRTHIMNEEKNSEILKIYRSTNVDGTKQLAKQAAEAGVKKIIFLSSVKVIGERTEHRCDNLSSNKQYIFSHKDDPNPQDPYSVSKLEAEKILWEISYKTGLEVVVVRLPLVYGHGVKGNLSRLMKLIKFGLPLPFNLVNNTRSLIGIDNLVDLLIRCIDCPKAVGKTFLVSDGEDLSTPKLIYHIASSMKQKVYLFSVPIFLLKFIGFIFGKQKEIDRLAGSLKIDNSYTKEILDWTPPISTEEGIRRMVQGK